MGNNYIPERPIYFTAKLLKSVAYSKLSAIEIRVLNEFYMKRKVKKMRNNGGREIRYIISNNGQIIFTCGWAKKNMDISKASFTRSIKKLILVGFIDLTYAGGGLQGDCNQYAISDRWKVFGTNEFEYTETPKKNSGGGFTIANWSERTGRKRRK